MYIVGFSAFGYCLQINRNIQPPNLSATLPMNTVAGSRSQIAKRRSSRIALNTPVGVSGEDREKCAFTLGQSNQPEPTRGRYPVES